MAGFQFITNQMKKHQAKGTKYALHKMLRGWRPGRAHKSVHASAVTKGGTGEFCAREYAIRDKEPHKVPDEFLDTSHRLTFAIGHYVQDQVINWLSDGNYAITNWVCQSCKTLHERCKRPSKCHACGCGAFKADEIRLISAVSGIGGGIDVFAQLGEPKLRIVEIKTMAPDEFKKLVAPLAEHRLRTNLYMRIAAESDDPWKTRINVDQAYVLYCSKGGFGTLDTNLKEMGIDDKFSPFKEFLIDRDDTQTEMLHQRAVRLKEFREKSKGMPAGLCPTAFTKRAQSCIVTSACFSGKYPAKED